MGEKGKQNRSATRAKASGERETKNLGCAGTHEPARRRRQLLRNKKTTQYNWGPKKSVPEVGHDYLEKRVEKMRGSQLQKKESS